MPPRRTWTARLELREEGGEVQAVERLARAA